jgi:predicted Zn-ribbon and HTH transcriptional regulator
MQALKELFEFKKIEVFKLPKKCHVCGYEYEKINYCPKCKEKEKEECIGFRFYWK